LSVVDVVFCVDDDDGLVLFIEETVLLVVNSSLSVLSVESVSVNRLDLINDQKLNDQKLKTKGKNQTFVQVDLIVKYSLLL
jgi:hypothetical protein